MNKKTPLKEILSPLFSVTLKLKFGNFLLNKKSKMKWYF